MNTEPTFENCEECDGDGIVECDECDGIGSFENGDTCDDCTGSGVVECGYCDGEGLVPVKPEESEDSE